MKKCVMAALVIAVALLGMLPGMTRGESGFTVAPAEIDVTVYGDGGSTAYVYITSQFDGELIVDTEGMPYRVEPGRVRVSSTDENRKVELAVLAEPGVEAGVYTGKLTFLAYTGTNVAYGIKMAFSVTQVNEEGASGPFLDKTIDAVADNYLIIVAVAGVLVALLTGVLIGRKWKRVPETKSDGEDE